MNRGAKKNGGGGLTSFFFKERTTRPISRSEIDAPIEISSPSNFRREGHVSYRAATGLFSGLDAPVSLFFGVPITSQPRMEVDGYTERIPSLLVLLVKEMIKRGGLQAEGIFRVPGETLALQRSKAALNSGRGMLALEGETGPHLIASLVKDWFRSLPEDETVLKNISKADIARLAKDERDPTEIYAEMRSLLPEPTRSIFCWIIDLLAVVCTHKDSNLMSPQALATVFAPTLFLADVAIESFALMADISTVLEKCVLGSIAQGDMEHKEHVFAD